MSLKTLTLPDSNVYKTDKAHFEPIDLFLDALPCSKRFDLMLGYFSSTAIYTISKGFALFLFNGGKMRMITNHIYSSKDKKALIKGKNQTPQHFNFSIKDYKKIKDSLDDYGIHFFNCLAWLISNNRIEIKIIKPKGSIGIAHYKSGLFDDGQDKLGFNGSCNFTHSGLVLNHEQITISKSFGGEAEVNAIKEFEDDFEEMFLGENKNLEYIDFEDLEEAIKTDFGNKDVKELLRDEKRLAQKSEVLNKRIRHKLDALENQIEEILSTPKFPFPEPRNYQVEAYNSWVANNYQGIFAMATGTGKTITSLNCLLNIYKETKSYKALIIVPTIALVNQWKKECKKFNFSNIIGVSSKEKWKDNLSFFSTASRFTNTSFIVIVTYASFARPKFQSYLKQLPSDTLLIADEMHNIGSPRILATLEDVHLNKRIGLSATPNRQYDEMGNKGIEDFFNDTFPYSFSYTMEQAIRNEPQALCEYTYYPHIVYLNEIELAEYVKKSKQLLKYFDSKTKRYKDCKEVEILLLERKRIIHKAQNKKAVFKQILKDEFKKRKNLKYTLVYVPEGVDVDYGERDEYIENEEDANLINQYTKIINDTDFSIMVQQFTSKTKNREVVLDKFSKGNTHVLCSMKCLDEGVDVPRSELAIFCASTGNPRQFIQRRGRVLRLHDDKNFATIHDLVVVPNSKDSSTFEMEKSVLRKELERVVDFSRLAMNKFDTYDILEEVLDYYNLNLNDF